jgi:hypothetical protein
MTRYEREKDSIARYHDANKEKIRDYKKQWMREKRGTVIQEPVTREHRLERMKQWRIDNPEKFSTARDKWADDHKDRVRDIRLKHALSKQIGCASSDVPSNLLEAKLAVTYVKRKVKELMK